MNRRELIQSAIGAAGLGLAGAEIVVDEVTVKPEDEVACFVLRCPRSFPHEAYSRIRDAIRIIFEGTKWEGTKVLVLEDGMTFEAVKLPKSVVEAVEKHWDAKNEP